MAILNQTNYNQYIAEGIRNSKGLASNLSIFSGGSMPEIVRQQIVRIIADALESINPNVPGNIPSEVYDAIATIMLPFTPSMTKNTLISVLKSNAVFGQITSGAPNIESIISDALNTFINQYERKLLELEGGIGAVLGSFGITGSLAQMAESISGDVIASVTSSLSSIFSPLEISNISIRTVATFLKGSGIFNITEIGPSFAVALSNPTVRSLVTTVSSPLGDIDLDELSSDQRDTFAAGYSIGASGSDVSLTQATDLMASTRGTIAGTRDAIEDLPGPNPYVIDDDTIDPAGSYISSVEELEAEMSSITREVSEVIIHWSETFTNSNLSGAQLTELTEAGDNVYHIIIRRDGSVERGVALNEIGEHCTINDHNDHSIGICLVGGLNASTGADDLYEVATARSITRSQYNSLYQIMRVFFNQYPGGQALGHGDIDPTQEDPGFDVRNYVYNNFNKLSLYTDPTTETGLTPEDILKKLEETESNVDALEKDPDVLEKKF
jgi:N-acetyl-anhydromuramyl-L-alanine amidase AmpD